MAGEGVATQVDTWVASMGRYDAEFANDGNYDTVSVTYSEGTEAWWKLTFPSTIVVDKILIYPRSCCKFMLHQVTGSDRIRCLLLCSCYQSDCLLINFHFSVYVGDELAGTVTYVEDQTMYSFSDLNLKGSVITLWNSATIFPGARSSDKRIELNEVEVYAGNGK